MDLKIILFFIFINSFFLFFFREIAAFINIFDYPDSIRKFHQKKIPLIGGYIILINLLLIFFTNIFFKEYLISNILHQEKSIFFILACCLLFFLGTIDDKYLISANKKLFFSFVILLFFLYFNDQSVLKELRFSFLDKKILLNNFSIFFTLFCFLLFINAFNMFDGINLQSGLYALISLIYLSILNPNEVLYFIIIIGLLFFLFLNCKNKTFLGDGGTYLISFIIGYCFIQNYNSSRIIYADQIFFIMLFPGLDLLRLSIVRILNKRHPFSSDRLHVHHLLLEKFKYNKTISIIFFLILFIEILSFNLLYNYLYIIIFSLIYLYLLIFLTMSNK